MLYIGIDIHKRAHEVVILDHVGKPQGKSFKMGNSHDDLETCCSNGLRKRILKRKPCVSGWKRPDITGWRSTAI